MNCLQKQSQGEGQKTVNRHPQNSDMLKKYGNIIQEQERTGFIERVDETAYTQEKKLYSSSSSTEGIKHYAYQNC